MEADEIEDIIAGVRPVALHGPLRKLLKKAMAKKGTPRSEHEDDSDEREEEEAEGEGAGKDKAKSEREALADLHAEHKGKGPEIPVTDEDLPESLRGDSEEEEPKKKGSVKRSK